MPKAFEQWTVLPHDPVEKLTDNVWRVEGALPRMPLRRVMTVARRADGALVIHNAIALEEGLMAELEALGPPTYLVVPNGYHRLDAKSFKARYPSLRVYCPRAARAKVEEVVPVDGSYDDFPADARVSLQHLDGTAAREGVMLVGEDANATLVFNDAIFNMPHLPGAQGFILRHLTQSTGGPRTTRIGRFFLIKDKKAFAAHLERLAETPGLRRVIVAHHQTITESPADALRSVASSLR